MRCHLSVFAVCALALRVGEQSGVDLFENGGDSQHADAVGFAVCVAGGGVEDIVVVARACGIFFGDVGKHFLAPFLAARWRDVPTRPKEAVAVLRAKGGGVNFNGGDAEHGVVELIRFGRAGDIFNDEFHARGAGAACFENTGEVAYQSALCSFADAPGAGVIFVCEGAFCAGDAGDNQNGFALVECGGDLAAAEFADVVDGADDRRHAVGGAPPIGNFARLFLYFHADVFVAGYTGAAEGIPRE